VTYTQEIFKFMLIYCTTEEIETLGEVRAAELATKRDEQAAEQLRLDCEG
jgi:hypothetical protein